MLLCMTHEINQRKITALLQKKKADGKCLLKTEDSVLMAGIKNEFDHSVRCSNLGD